MSFSQQMYHDVVKFNGCTFVIYKTIINCCCMFQIELPMLLLYQLQQTKYTIKALNLIFFVICLNELCEINIPWCSCGLWISPPPMTLQGVATLSVPESAVPDNRKVGNQVLCPHSRCFGSHFDVIYLYGLYGLP